jgi:hypothetical protein
MHAGEAAPTASGPLLQPDSRGLAAGGDGQGDGTAGRACGAGSGGGAYNRCLAARQRLKSAASSPQAPWMSSQEYPWEANLVPAVSELPLENVTS